MNYWIKIMKLYNTLTRKIEQIPKSKVLTIYTCGPTVYDYLHIGNWVAYIRWDILVRTLEKNGFKVMWIMNITDVGHLVSDADDGEDKLEKGAKREGKTAWEIADKYTGDFIKGLNLLNITIDHKNLIRATDFIDEQIDLIEKLDAKGYTYLIDDGVYFDSSKFPDYNKLSRIKINELKAGARVNYNTQKRNLNDFALWKFSPKNSKRDMEWQSPWGLGFPGWHLECSAIAMKFLGETIDIHAGGIDHIPIHHTNEIAQSQAATGKLFSKCWIHSNFLTVNGTKISKSLQNGYTLDDLKKKGFDPLEFRLFVLQSHFQSESNFTFEGLSAAAHRLKTFRAAVVMRFQSNKLAPQWLTIDIIKEITADLSENLNSPRVLSRLNEFFDNVIEKGINPIQLKLYIKILTNLDDLLGLNFLSLKDISKDIKDIIDARQIYRVKQNFAKSDQLRLEIERFGVAIRDTNLGQYWYYK